MPAGVAVVMVAAGATVGAGDADGAGIVAGVSAPAAPAVLAAVTVAVAVVGEDGTVGVFVGGVGLREGCVVAVPFAATPWAVMSIASPSAMPRPTQTMNRRNSWESRISRSTTPIARPSP